MYKSRTSSVICRKGERGNKKGDARNRTWSISELDGMVTSLSIRKPCCVDQLACQSQTQRREIQHMCGVRTPPVRVSASTVMRWARASWNMVASSMASCRGRRHAERQPTVKGLVRAPPLRARSKPSTWKQKKTSGRSSRKWGEVQLGACSALIILRCDDASPAQ